MSIQATQSCVSCSRIWSITAGRSGSFESTRRKGSCPAAPRPLVQPPMPSFNRARLILAQISSDALRTPNLCRPTHFWQNEANILQCNQSNFDAHGSRDQYSRTASSRICAGCALLEGDRFRLVVADPAEGREPRSSWSKRCTRGRRHRG
jgi:hypothetical protein